MIELVPARLTHVGPIAARMRQADRVECEALGRVPKDALRAGLRMSLHPITALVDGRPEMMLGVMSDSLVEGTGTVWALGSDEVYRSPRALLALGPGIVTWMLRDFRHLSNLVSIDNDRAIRFMRRLGFVVGGSVQIHGGVAFVPFWIRRAIQAERVAA